MRPEAEFDDPQSPTARIIRGRAQILARRGHFPACERNDLEQQLFLAVWSRIERFDPRRASLPTFVRRVADGEAAKILRARRAAKRDRRRGIPPFETKDGAAGMSWETKLSEDAHDRRLDRRLSDRREASEQRMDVESVLERLGPADQQLCRRLMHETITEVAASQKTSRAAVYRRLARLRRRFGDFRKSE
jgi:RNA polymerase sigma-70 factor (ECF subfamily)